jgi:hypothetical protein
MEDEKPGAVLPGVHEEEVHLHEREDHVEDGVDAGEEVPVPTVLRYLEEVDKLCQQTQSILHLVNLLYLPKGTTNTCWHLAQQ